MTEAEAINILQLNTPFVASKEANKAVELAINALEKIQKLEENKTYHLYREYLSLGTVEELRTLKEKQIAKKPVGLKKNICPNCSWGIVMTTQKYCDECGQKLDR